jgi:hypothetical protein
LLVSTTTSTVPGPPAGVVTSSRLSLTNLTAVAAAPPKSTFASPYRPLPSTVTTCPPATLPDAGLTLCTSGLSLASAAALTETLTPSDADEPTWSVTVSSTSWSPTGRVRSHVLPVQSTWSPDAARLRHAYAATYPLTTGGPAEK